MGCGTLKEIRNMKACTTCKYGYEDEQLGIPMCHHPKRFSEDCVDFNMHEEKEIKGTEKPMNPSGSSEIPKDLEEAAKAYADDTNPTDSFYEAFKEGALWMREKMMKEAVEGEVTETCGISSVWIKTKQFKPGQKVRIIIVKEDNQ